MHAAVLKKLDVKDGGVCVRNVVQTNGGDETV
jgi:hypothetical protein